MKRWFVGCLLALMVLCGCEALTVSAAVGKADHTVYDYSSAEGWPTPPEITAGSAYLIELNSGAVLYEKDAEVQSFPASTTKILTALLALENCSLDEEITLSHEAIYDLEEGGHHYEFEEGEVLTVSECLQFLLVESVNEVAYALAEHISGSLSEFSALMNERAVELGATATHFNNPHGLNDDNHYTTAHDMAMILWGCIQSEAFCHYASLQSVSLAGRAVRTDGFSTYTNHHLMLLPDSPSYNASVVCGKTGFTSLAGQTLVTYASQDGMDVICIIMQGGDDRFEDTQKLLDYAFDSFTLLPWDAVQASRSELLGDFGLVTAVPDGNCLLIPAGADLSAVTTDFTVRSTTERSSLMGVMNWYYQGLLMGSAEVTAELSEMVRTGSASVEEGEAEYASGLSGSSTGGGSRFPYLLGLVLLAVILLILCAVLIRILLRRSRRNRRRRARKKQRRKK